VEKSEFEKKEDELYARSKSATSEIMRNLVSQLKETSRYLNGDAEVINEDYVLLKIRIEREAQKLARESAFLPPAPVIEAPKPPETPRLKDFNLQGTTTQMKLIVDVKDPKITIQSVLLETNTV